MRVYPEYVLIIEFDFRLGLQERYYRFATSEMLPWLYKQKVYLQEEWQRLYGGATERRLEFVTEELEILHQLFENPKWQELEKRLQDYTRNYTRRVLPYRRNFRI